MQRKLLIAGVLVCAVCVPALAYSQAPSSGTFTATDPHAWSANGTGATTMTVTAPATVTFEYPPGPGSNGHNVVWEGKEPACDASIPDGTKYGIRPWKGDCRFTTPGTYRFECAIHYGLMKGTVVVVAPAQSATPSPTPTAGADPGATATPGASQPPPTGSDPVDTAPAATALSAKIAGSQKGGRVRGTVTAHGRVEITVKLKQRRVGRTVKNAAGRTTFTVRLNAKARKELKRKRTLRLRVTVAVTPPSGAKQKRTFTVKLRG